MLIFDEPINGLDPEGIRWIRDLMGRLATDGRTVFVSSHLMAEMALTATSLVVIGGGRLIAAESTRAVTNRAEHRVIVRSPQLAQLSAELVRTGADVHQVDGALEVFGFGIEHVGTLAATLGVTIFELSTQRASLEDAFMQLTAQFCEFTTPVDLEELVS